MNGNSPDEEHYNTVTTELSSGRVVPFFGAGVNRCGRPADINWLDNHYLPGGCELSTYLANRFGYPEIANSDLVRVSQYITIMQGLGPLYEELHSLFDTDYTPTPLHRFFATLPAILHEKGCSPPYQLIVTTNYDDLMESAFRQAGQEYDLVCYIAEGEQRGKFLHWLPGGQARLIEKPNEYRDLSLDKRPVILKIHGAVQRGSDPEQDSYVITEDHYIDYLTHTDLASLIPVTLAAKLRKSHFLFLGYSLRDWNLRVILHRIWGDRKLTYKSWAIQLNPERLDQKFWRKRDVDIFNTSLEDYIDELARRLQALPKLAKRLQALPTRVPA